MILLIDACAREESRTRRIANKVIDKLSDDVTVLNLYDEGLVPLDNDKLNFRDSAIAKADYSNDMFKYAKQFRDADTIVFAAPYWDLSFPSIVKCYIESLCVNGITFVYGEDGRPKGLCKANKLIYVTTAGGFIQENDHGYGYIKDLANILFGITDVSLIKAEGLDIRGADIEGILKEVEEKI